jgi:NADH-quinone oxidoreductase subunit L
MVNLVANFWWIPLYPLLGAAWCGIVRRGAATVATSMVLLAFLHGLAVFSAPRAGALTHTVGQWMPNIPFRLVADELSLMMVLIITGIGFLIHVYSKGYMRDEGGYWRYFACLNLFVFFMLVLVLASNLVVMFAGWEGVGLASYLLIGFHHDRPMVNRNANKAFLYNRAGDVGFLLGTLILLAVAGTVEFTDLNKLPGSSLMMGAALLLALGASGKSAQLPLFVWLPDAMVGPTPVSALIHAATMVTAGIYLFARLDPFLAANPEAGFVIAVVGGLTALIAATVALVEHDIKRILAYSTVSQLGLMFLAAGLGATGAAMFHVVTHAFFKALLFLTAGNIIHALHGEQDMRFMGGLKDKMPWTFRLMTLGALSLAGFPGLAGFFSKDAILVAAVKSPVLLGLGFVVSFLTACYAGRMLWGIFFGAYNREGHEAHGGMLHSLWPLAIGSAVAGYFGPHQEGALGIMIASGVVAIVGLYVGRHIRLPILLKEFFSKKWYINEGYEQVFVTGGGKYAAEGLSWFDRNVIDLAPRATGWMTELASVLSGWFDRFVVDGVVKLASFGVEAASYPVRLVQHGRVHNYALILVLTVAATFGWYLLQ